MRRLAVVALALGLGLTACRGPGEPPAASPSGPSGGTTPSSTESPTPASPASEVRCTLVLGMSVTRNWFEEGAFETLSGIDGAEWELIVEGGEDVAFWANPNAPPYSRPPISPCEDEPDRALFQVAAREQEVPPSEGLVDAIRATVDNIRAAWPTVEVVELIPVVGGPGGEPCDAVSQPGRLVDASVVNPAMNAAIALVANGTDIVAGPDLLLAECSQYLDGIGHLTTEGSAYIASILAEHYGT